MFKSIKIHTLNMIGEKKISLFFELKKKVHISCDGRFYNGFIIEVNLDKEFLLLRDDKLGEVPILFEEILNIEPCREKRE